MALTATYECRRIEVDAREVTNRIHVLLTSSDACTKPIVNRDSDGNWEVSATLVSAVRDYEVIESIVREAVPDMVFYLVVENTIKVNDKGSAMISTERISFGGSKGGRILIDVWVPLSGKQ